MLTVTIAIILCYCMGLSAQWISPETLGLPTYFVMLMPLWIILMMCCIIFWLSFKKWGYALVVIGIMAVTFGQWRNVVTINKPFKSRI